MIGGGGDPPHVTSPVWALPPPRKQAFRQWFRKNLWQIVSIGVKTPSNTNLAAFRDATCKKEKSLFRLTCAAQNPPKHPYLPISQQHFPPKDRLLFPNLPARKKFAWRTDILRKRSIWCPWLSCQKCLSKSSRKRLPLMFTSKLLTRA